jgi:hypothetical protein
MNPAAHCETLFNQVDDLGAGIAAIGDLLQFSKDEAFPDTLNGVGIVLRQLGANMRGLNTQFLDEPYRGIRALEIKAGPAPALVETQARDVPEATGEGSIEERLRDLITGAFVKKGEKRP